MPQSMFLNTSNGDSILNPEQVAGLLIRPTETQSLAAQVSTVTRLGDNPALRFPLLKADPAVNWTHEGEEIQQAQPEFDEITVYANKTAGLVVASREVVEDSDPAAINQVGAGLVRQIVNNIDAAFFGNLPDPAPAGLESIDNPALVEASAGNLDWAEEALAAAAGHGETIDNFICHPADALALAVMKESENSRRGLLQSDPTQPATRTVAGVPLLTSTHVTRGTAWGIPRTASQIIIRDDAKVDVDSSAFFTSDRLAIRAIMRVGAGFTHPAAIVKIQLDTEDAEGNG